VNAWAEVERLALELEDLQRRKVLDLARRLLPGLTLEDVRNPHDFPELTDPDWQYEDGILTGIQSVLAAVRARIHERGSHIEDRAAASAPPVPDGEPDHGAGR
jgi:hypothetical protein